MGRLETPSDRGTHGGHPGGPPDVETSLDPKDWSSFRELCTSELCGLLDYLEGAADRPVWRPIPAGIKQSLAAPLPMEPQETRQVCDEIRNLVLPYTLGNTHPRFFGWVHGTGTAGGLLAELFAATMNANLGGREHAPVYVERVVIQWCKQMFSFPESASGLLLSGTSMGNLVALAVARNHHSPTNVRELGVAACPAQLTAYTSAEAHSSIAKAFELLGLGRANLKRIPANRNRQIDLHLLEQYVAADRAAGLQPFCVIGSAGTVNSGAIDNLEALAEFCRQERLWFHVDGAFGALAILTDECRPLLRGIERADSLAFDFHKWLHVPYDAGCVLIRDGRTHAAAFEHDAHYLAEGRGAAAGAPWFCQLGPELSRGFRALKVWFTIKEHGVRRLGEKIADNCRQAQFLGRLVIGHPHLQLLAPVSLNIVCFRYVTSSLPSSELDRLNAEIVVELQERGIAAPSTTIIDGQLAIRVNVTNHRTRMSDLRVLVEAIDEIAPAAMERIRPARTQRLTAAEVSANKLIASSASRSDLQPLLADVQLSYDPELLLPFCVHLDGTIHLGPQALGSAAACAILMRHALELAAVGKRIPRGSPLLEAALALFACRTAAAYCSLFPAPQGLPVWLAAAYSCGVPLKQLLPLQQVDGAMAEALRPADGDTLEVRLRQSQPVAGPTEILLTAGGDSRLDIDPRTGLSRYGCRRQPLAALAAFGSCTATAVTRENLAAAEQMRQHLIAAAIQGEFAAQHAECTDTLKQQIRECFAIDDMPRVETLLCSSGTDAELYAVCLAAGLKPRKLTNIIIAPAETGTGVPEAAGGRHFATQTPLGFLVTPSERLDGLEHVALEVIRIDARDERGALRPQGEIDDDARRAVESGVRHGMCLLHVLDASKTGWRAPSLRLVRELTSRFADRLLVIVDACQARLDRDRLRRYLDEGCLVQITGSKNFGGPPFSGALLVPPTIARRVQAGQLPIGLADYATRTEWPADWECTRFLRTDRHNAGLLLRWTAAVREMRSFHQVPDRLRAEILRELAACVQAVMDTTDCVDPHANAVEEHVPHIAAGEWDAVPTIFPFRVRHQDQWRGAAFLDHGQLKTLHRWLNSDLSMIPAAWNTASQRSLAAFVCHIGQPVDVGRSTGGDISVLRFCTGANVVSRIVFDESLGTTLELRREHEQQRIRRVFDKIALIVEHWQAIDRYEAGFSRRREGIPSALEAVR